VARTRNRQAAEAAKDNRELRARLAELGAAPVLLVDDLADSRWTLTVAGRELRRAGAGSVLPFALALTA
jgi:ATP-dependent DNA helicase RecQ